MQVLTARYRGTKGKPTKGKQDAGKHNDFQFRQKCEGNAASLVKDSIFAP